VVGVLLGIGGNAIPNLRFAWINNLIYILVNLIVIWLISVAGGKSRQKKAESKKS